MKQPIRLAFAFITAGVFLWLIGRQFRFDEVQHILRETSLRWIGLAAGMFCLGYVCRIERWRLMLAQNNLLLGWKSCAGPLLASIAVNNVLPFRAGDILRAFAFNRKLGVSAATSVTALLVERLLDLLMLVSSLGIALAYFEINSLQLLGIGSDILIACSVIIVLLLFFPTLCKPLILGLGNFVAKCLPHLAEKIHGEIQQVFSALEYVVKGGIMLKLVCWSVLAWVAEGGVFWFCALSLAPIGHHLAAWLAFPVGTLATVIPSTPGYVGTFDYFTAQAMTMLGNAPAASVAYAFLVHLLLWLLPTLVGGSYLLFNPVRRKGRVLCWPR